MSEVVNSVLEQNMLSSLFLSILKFANILETLTDMLFRCDELWAGSRVGEILSARGTAASCLCVFVVHCYLDVLLFKLCCLTFQLFHMLCGEWRCCLLHYRILHGNHSGAESIDVWLFWCFLHFGNMCSLHHRQFLFFKHPFHVNGSLMQKNSRFSEVHRYSSKNITVSPSYPCFSFVVFRITF